MASAWVPTPARRVPENSEILLSGKVRHVGKVLVDLSGTQLLLDGKHWLITDSSILIQVLNEVTDG